HRVEPLFQRRLVALERFHRLVSPTEQIAADVLRPRWSLQRASPGIWYPRRTPPIGEETLALGDVFPQQGHVVVEGEFHLPPVGRELGELELGGQPAVFPDVAEQSAPRISRLVRSLRADEALPSDDELVALGLAADDWMVFEDQT